DGRVPRGREGRADGGQHRFGRLSPRARRGADRAGGAARRGRCTAEVGCRMSVRVAPDQKQRVTLTVNGKVRSGFAEPRMLLTDFLRHELQAFGVHVGCEHGVCGACTVLIDAKAMRSCTRYAVQMDGAEIVTVEGLADP